MKLTNKQQEVVNLILDKQNEIGKKLYVTYINGLNKMFIVDVVVTSEGNIKINRIEQINTKIAYTLLDKNILVSEKINDNLSLVTLNN